MNSSENKNSQHRPYFVDGKSSMCATCKHSEIMGEHNILVCTIYKGATCYKSKKFDSWKPKYEFIREDEMKL